MRSVARTLGANLGIRTTGAVLVDFDGFRRTIDLLGGINVDVSHAIDDEFVRGDGDLFSAHFRPGLQRLDGEAALTYVRTRKSDGDVWRRSRHADVAIAIAEALRRPRTLFRLPGLLRTARRSVRTTLPPLALAAAALTAARIRRRNTTTTVLRSPVVTSEQLEDGRWAHRGDARTIAMSVRDGLYGRNALAAAERPDGPTSR
jgi:anionic cell wall polymer biosynthesis LytR-Cps2A-Psr (LCP) family protein